MALLTRMVFCLLLFSAGCAFANNYTTVIYSDYAMGSSVLYEGIFSEVTNHSYAKDEYNVIVAQDGSGEYRSIQEAINNAPSFPYKRVVIHIKNGNYFEKVMIPEWNTNMSLIGESQEKTIITYDDNFNKIGLGRNSTFFTSVLLVEGNDCLLSNLTVKNTSGLVGQAIALSVVATRVVVSNCAILGNQDTLYVSGEGAKQYFKNCYIEGTVDFIFGGATALFDHCTIHSKSDSYITAASTPSDQLFGLVFRNCNLTADVGLTKVFLGRPWRINAKTVFINCKMAGHISSEGWGNWSKSEANKKCYYAEYNCFGEGFQPSKRVVWSHQLKKSEAKKYTIENCMGLRFYRDMLKLTYDKIQM